VLSQENITSVFVKQTKPFYKYSICHQEVGTVAQTVQFARGGFFFLVNKTIYRSIQNMGVMFLESCDYQN
jgi:hypothetical protein